MELDHPVRVCRTPPSVRRNALMDTRLPIPRTNTLVPTSEMIYFSAMACPCFHKSCHCSVHLPLQADAHTTSHPSRIRSWLSCTRTAQWRQLSLYMQISCSTRRVRLVWIWSRINSETGQNRLKDIEIVKRCNQQFFSPKPCVVTLNVIAGVYQHVTGEMLGGHAIKILGWGEENGTPYWLAANSWNGDWGDKGTSQPSCSYIPSDSRDTIWQVLPLNHILCLFLSGFFKIKRGTDECGIESEMVAGIPLN